VTNLPDPDDQALFALVHRSLFTAVLGDVMDTAGLTRQFLPPTIRALTPDCKLVGRAMTVLEADCGGEAGVHGHSGPFGMMFNALDDMHPGEVYVCTGASPRYALWGGLMSTRARALGAVGAIVDGFHRDTREILALRFPVFSAGSYAQDQRLRGRVIDYRCPIEFGNGCRVNPGDLLVGDIDGVVVVPREDEQSVIRAAVAKVEGEDEVRRMILAGQSTAEIFAKTGIM
jgi:regulator of RNase E activity RraA